MSSARVSSIAVLLSLVAAICWQNAEAGDSGAARRIHESPRVVRRAQTTPPPPGSMTSRRDPTTQTAPGNQGSGQTVVPIESGRSYVIDVAVMVLLLGGALFVTCRSAGRV